MIHTTLLRLLGCTSLLSALLAPHGAQAQTPSPPQFVNASTCSYENSQSGLFVFGPYLYGSSGTAYCNFAPPVHTYGQPLPALNTVAISGFTRNGGQVKTRVCTTVSFAGEARLACGAERTSVGSFNDILELPTSNEIPTGYFLIVNLSPPFAAVSGLSATWLR